MIRYKKNPKGSSKIIEVDGKQYQAKYIGKGHFSRVYRVGDRVVYFTRGDCGKEVLAMFLYDKMAHLPDLTRHENITTVRGIWYVFSSPFYRDIKRSDTSAWTLMKEIVRYQSAYHAIAYKEGYRNVELMRMIVIMMQDYSSLPKSVMKALYEIMDAASNCGDNVGFDLHKKNFGVNEYGTLIFRDPIYVRE
jgi:hypothetical protein